MAKISRLNTLRKNFSAYADEYRFLYDNNHTQEEAVQPACVIVLASNRGFCGSFNTELINYAMEQLETLAEPVPVIACGEKTVTLLRERKRQPAYTFLWGDSPTFGECQPLFDLLDEMIGDKKDAAVQVIYPNYRNTMLQVPTTTTLSPSGDPAAMEDLVWLPDRETVLSEIQKKGFRALLYGMILETALGAQAATLMTMRSANDTATEYADALELQIQRQRQSEVTADVIEISAERGSKGEKLNV
ncbi:MAG: F0F1 ATP synthase subunit gamma [Clostridia bacterium]|nr:F0F1 ATP synthase subunit gamma [Clostridia bacterium]